MPFTTIPTVADGSILTASYLNLLGSNVGFVYGLANQSNAPFASHRSVQVTLTQSEAWWRIRHKNQYLHWKITSQGSSWNYARLYYNGVKVGNMGGGTTWTGIFNLWQWAGLPNMVGAWVTGFAYDDDVNGSGDDGHAVTSGGQTYRCILSHTSAGGNAPPNATYWELLTLPGVNTMCQTWAEVNFSAGTEVTVEYILESDSVTI